MRKMPLNFKRGQAISKGKHLLPPLQINHRTNKAVLATIHTSPLRLATMVAYSSVQKSLQL